MPNMQLLMQKILPKLVLLKNVNTQSAKLEDVLANISKYSVKMRNNGGGHYNHELFWKSMAPPNSTALQVKLKDVIIEKSFNSNRYFYFLQLFYSWGSKTLNRIFTYPLPAGI